MVCWARSVVNGGSEEGCVEGQKGLIYYSWNAAEDTAFSHSLSPPRKVPAAPIIRH